MKKIWKWEMNIAAGDNLLVTMPKGVKLLSVGKQPGQPVGIFSFWGIADANEEVFVHRRMVVRGTGHDAPGDHAAFVGTVVDDRLVWHLFDFGERSL